MILAPRASAYSLRLSGGAHPLLYAGADRHRPRAESFASTSAAIGGPFQPTDQNGKPITDRDLKGRPSLVFLASRIARSPPATLFDISEILQQARPRRQQSECGFHYRSIRSAILLRY